MNSVISILEDTFRMITFQNAPRRIRNGFPDREEGPRDRHGAGRGIRRRLTDTPRRDALG